MNCVAHLEHLQTILQEFNANSVILEPILIYLFHDVLRPSICAQAEQEGPQKNT